MRLSTCNLHGQNNSAGVSLLIRNINFRQFVLSVPITQQCDTSDTWLEAGGVCLGPLKVDAAIALQRPQFRQHQEQYLRLHDERTKRLWFLWEDTSPSRRMGVSGVCGCLGNCRFFGLNRNGPGFFDPSEKDFEDSRATAVFHICVDENNYGYGQSILGEEKVKDLIIDRLPSASFLSNPTREYLKRQQSNSALTLLHSATAVRADYILPFTPVLEETPESVKSERTLTVASPPPDLQPVTKSDLVATPAQRPGILDLKPIEVRFHDYF